MKESKGFSLFPEKQFHIVFNGIDSGDAEVFNEKSCNIRLKNAGSVGPRWMFLTPRDSSAEEQSQLSARTRKYCR